MQVATCHRRGQMPNFYNYFNANELARSSFVFLRWEMVIKILCAGDVLSHILPYTLQHHIPGGSNPDNGSLVLLNQTFFVVFTISGVLSFASTLTAVVVFLSILTSSFRFEDFKESLPKRLVFGISCIIFSLTMMVLAFAATIILMIKNMQQWTRIALYGITFLPVSVLVATYLPFYVPLMRIFHCTVAKVKSMLPRFHVEYGNIHKSSFFKSKESTMLENGKFEAYFLNMFLMEFPKTNDWRLNLVTRT
ncbi:Ankyrin repeat-containing protein [Heracleum sosnowskyi]|uniref:Ankyrin repeat-containing protein n=1 Tax=Heracleum sosnowskyi TaxID=360622 RepID=A0AAD8MY10_9APIA|nr:Ankyrin repeat-containing protein [Heracleum sosnowskyi]